MLKDRISQVFRYHEPNIPPLYEIEDLTGSSPSLIMRTINKMGIEYPQDKKISNRAIEYFKHYKQGMDIKDLAKVCGVSYSQIARQYESLIVLGANIKVKYYEGVYDKSILKRPKGIKRLSSDKGVYIKVTDGRYKGATGYLEPFTDTANATLWINGEQVTVKLETCDYREYGRAV